jgi:branched-chain amino acid transport system permease protein
VLLAAAAVVLVIALPGLMPNNYFRGLLVLTAIYAIYGIGFDVQFGYAGLFNMAQGAFFGVGAYAVALVSTELETSNVIVALPIAIAAGVVIAALLGTIALKVGSPPIVFAMISLGLSQILTLIVLNEDQWTMGPAGLAVSPPTLDLGPLSLTFTSIESQFYLGVVTLVITVFVVTRVLRSRLGSSWLCVRENVALARSQGVRPVRAQMMSLIVGAAITSASGGLYAYYIGFLTPVVFALTTLVTAIVVGVIGGSGTIYGPIIGAALYVIVPEMLSTTADLRLLIFGAILCVVMLFMPNGTWPLLVAGAQRVQKRVRR